MRGSPEKPQPNPKPPPLPPRALRVESTAAAVAQRCWSGRRLACKAAKLPPEAAAGQTRPPAGKTEVLHSSRCSSRVGTRHGAVGVSRDRLSLRTRTTAVGAFAQKAETGRGAPLGAGGNRGRLGTSVPPERRLRRGRHAKFPLHSGPRRGRSARAGAGAGRLPDPGPVSRPAEALGLAGTRSRSHPGTPARGRDPDPDGEHPFTCSRRRQVLPALLRATPGSRTRAPGRGPAPPSR